jgi:hypothetical protein|tara:strand:- start:2300 stop:2536 length:237 start_codon:yes stop_codon:yes gene_type:complete
MMPIYNLKRISTGEEFEVTMSWNELQETLNVDPDLFQMLSTPKFVTDTKGTLSRAGSDWREHLGRIKDNSGRGNTIKT